jgi:pantoate--beta-alanine ligase
VKTVTGIPKMQELSRQMHAGGLTVGFVPTMGYLHDGHLELVRRARTECDVVVVSIFVNPTQFDNREDFAKYPRDVAADRAVLEHAGVDVLFLPEASEVYAPGAATSVRVGALGDHLCGPTRPGHFDGMATIVAALFNMVMPDVAVFGEKDWQQLQIVRRLVRDLHVPVKIVGVPTVRESDGLAMSSRNARLGEKERALAPALHRALRAAVEAYHGGERRSAALFDTARAVIAAARGFEIEYLEIVDGEALTPAATANDGCVVAVAACLGGVRLIDNVSLARPRMLETSSGADIRMRSEDAHHA